MKKLLSIILCLAMLSSFASLLPVNVGADPAEYQKINAGEIVTVTLEGDPAIAYLKFVPEEDGAYTVYSLADADSYGYIYDENMNELMCDDDSGDAGNFSMTLGMSAGTVYYIGARYYSYDPGSFRVAVKKEPPVEGIQFSENEQTVYVGEDKMNYASPIPSDTYVYDYEWTSSDESVATVSSGDAYVYATGVSEGDATITATLNGSVSASYTLHVIERPPVSSILLSRYRIEGYVGDQGYVYIDVEPEDAEADEIIWESSDESVFSANASYYNGDPYTYLTYKSAGEGMLTVTVNGEFSASCHVIVSERPELTDAALSYTDMNGYVGSYKYIFVSGVPEDALWSEAVWTSSDESVATVESYYYKDEACVNFIGTGSAVITATLDGKVSASCTVTVTERPYASTIEFEYSDLTGYVGDSGYNSAIIGPEDSIVNDIVWTSSNNGVAYVNSAIYNGRRYVYIDYLAEGSATITLTVNGEISESFDVSVSERPTVSSVEFDCSPLTGYVGEELYTYIYIYPEDAEITDIVWSSSDNDVLYLDGSAYKGERHAYAYGVSAGSATINVTVNGEISATCPVTVEERPKVSYAYLSDSLMNGFAGETGYNYIVIQPDDAYVEEIVWTSSDDSVFSANGEYYNGNQYTYVTYNAPGTATLSATVNGEITASCTVVVSERPALSAIKFDEEVKKGYVGQNWIIHYSVSPDGATAGDLVYYSSDESVVTAEEYNYGSDSVLLHFLSAGTATVTITAPNGVSASIDIVSRVPVTLYEDVPTAVSIDKYNSEESFCFTPATTGEYVFGISDQSDDTKTVGMHLYDEEGNRLDSSQDGKLTCTLTAGQKYDLDVQCTTYSESPEVDFDLTVSKTVAATGMKVIPAEAESYVDTGRLLEVEFEPWNARFETVTWSSTNESAVTVDEYGWITYVSEGTATITATSENGLSATCAARAKDYELIALDQTKTAEIAEDGEYVYFRFIPEEDGTYVFYSSSNFDTYGYIFDNYFNELASDDDGGVENNFSVSYKMRAGTSYLLGARFFGNNGTGSFFVAVKRAPAAKGIDISNTRLSGFVGTSYYVYLEYDPYDAEKQETTWTSSSNGVVELTEGDEKGVNIRFVSAGNTVITATTDKGLKVTCSVTVKEPGTLYEDTPETVEIINNEQQAYYFTPSASGNYVFACMNHSNDNKTRIQVYSDQGDGLYSSDDMTLSCVLSAGTRYLVMTNYHSYSMEGNGTYELIVSKAVPATSVSILPRTTFNKYVGTEQRLTPEIEPWNANTLGITWTSSNNSVASIGFRNGSPYVYAGSVGTATVTVTLSNGLSASCTFNVKDYDPFAAGETKTAVIEAEDEYAYYRFIPEHDGCYAFYSTSDSDTYGYVYDSNLGILARNDDGGEGNNFRVKYFMSAGETYILGARYNIGTMTGSFSVSLEEVPYISGLQILTLPSKLEYLNYDVRNHISFAGLSMKVTWSDGTQTEWVYGKDGIYIEDEYVEFDLSTVEADATVYIHCGGQTEHYQITFIDDPVESIELVSASSTEYIENFNGYEYDWFNEASGEYEKRFLYYTESHRDAVIKINYANGTSKTANVGEYVDGYSVSWSADQEDSPWTLGSNNPSVISYLGHTVNMPIVVVPNPVASLELVTASSSVYYENTNGYSFLWRDPSSGEYVEKYYYYSKDHGDAVIKINYTNGTSKTVHVGDKVGEYYVNWYSEQDDSPWSLGSNNTIIISYLGKTVNMPVTVIQNPVTSIEIVSGLTTPVYENASGYWDARWVGEDYEEFYYYTPNYSEVVVRVNYENGPSKTGNVGTNIDGFGINVDGNQYKTPWTVGSGNTATVYYAGKEVALSVTVLPNPVDSIALDSAPSRVYIYGDTAYGWPYPSGEYEFYNLDLTGLAFTVHYKNGTSKKYTSANISNWKIDGQPYSLNHRIFLEGPATIPVTFTYMGKTLEFNVSVVEADVSSIEQLSPPTNPNCDLDNYFVPNWTGYKFRVNYTNGLHKDYELTADDLVATVGGAYGFVTGFVVDGTRGDFIGEIGGDFTLSFLGKTCPVTGINNTHGKTIRSVALSNVTSSCNGMKVDITYDDNTKKQIVLNRFIPSTGSWGSGGATPFVALTEDGILLFNMNEDNENFTFYILDKQVVVPKRVILPGDANGDKRVDMRDVLLMRKHILNIQKVTAANFDNADMDGDGRISMKDVLAVRKKILNIH
ncbi:MAG: Ig-like domain-containing protein [Clostridia bacterium]|nr:Ig-like domain-containing protein [Clostridia bacterium]